MNIISKIILEKKFNYKNIIIFDNIKVVIIHIN